MTISRSSRRSSSASSSGAAEPSLSQERPGQNPPTGDSSLSALLSLAWELTSAPNSLVSGFMEGGESDELAQAMRREASTLQREIDKAQKKLNIILRALAAMDELKSESLPRPGYSGKRGGKPLPPGVSMNWAQVGEAILKDQGRPMTPLEMVPYVEQYRRVDPDKKPSWLLSNNLRQRPEIFGRVTWRGMTRWWLKERPLPPE